MMHGLTNFKFTIIDLKPHPTPALKGKYYGMKYEDISLT
jgi:hypothetical protein